VDSGTTLALFPNSVVASFYKGAPVSLFSGSYYVKVTDVAKLKPLVITISGNKFTLSAQQQIANPTVYYTKSGNVYTYYYQLGIQGLGNVNAGSVSIILGDTFLKAYYSVYDYKTAQVGLAPSVVKPKLPKLSG